MVQIYLNLNKDKQIENRKKNEKYKKKQKKPKNRIRNKKTFLFVFYIKNTFFPSLIIHWSTKFGVMSVSEIKMADSYAFWYTESKTEKQIIPSRPTAEISPIL